jgi:hypothetical protein
LARTEETRVGIGREGFLASHAVGLEIVLAAQPVVIHPGDVRHAGVEVDLFLLVRGKRRAEPFAGHP